MNTPRPIEPQDIRVGDRVRAVNEYENGERCEYEGTIVGSSFPGYLSTKRFTWYLAGDYTFTLLDRPEPPREPGSRWEDPETGARYVKTDGPGDMRYARYFRGNGDDQVWLTPNFGAAVARLIPLDPS